jgi:HSP20 family protein
LADILRLSPAICVYPDEKCENVTVEVILPGVEKKDISFKISDNGFYVRATKGGVAYADSYAFCCPVEPEKQLLTIQMVYLKSQYLINSLQKN